MLKPAQLYEEKLQKANVESWYDLSNQYCNSWCCDDEIVLEKSNGQYHQFVSVDKNDNVIGYITYSVDWSSMSASRFGIISYDKGNLLFIRDVQKVVHNIFFKYNFNRIEWRAYEDNSAISGYRKFIKRFGGKECGYLRQTVKLMDGKLHDMAIFEILREDLKIKRGDFCPNYGAKIGGETNDT